MYDEVLTEVTVEVEAELRANLAHRTPSLVGPISDWLDEAFAGSSLAEVFTRADAFPMLLLPWWADGSIGDRNRDLHRHLAYSTMNGYLYIRLIDNLMDGDAPGAPELLPALGFFHLEFIEPYLTLFPSDHRFWRDLRTVWLETADVTVHDAQLVDVDREAFEQVSARKTGAAIIPVAAVLHYLGKAESRLLWDEFVQALGRWHQMHNDIFGWRKDLAHGAATFFLSEGRRRRPDGVEAWIVDGGFAWGMDELARSMAELKRLALSLDADEAVRYLDERDEAVRTRATEIERDLDLVLRLHGARSS